MSAPAGSISFVLPAGGAGRRLGGRCKPFLEVAGRPLVLHTLERVRAVAGLAEVVVVLPAAACAELSARHGAALASAGVSRVVPGGTSRQTSVARGLESLQEPCELVAVHDAVRPFASAALAERLAAAAREHGGALPVLPVTDTLKRGEELPDGSVRILGTRPREGLYAVQTPQIFRRDLLARAYAQAADLGASVTDDAALVEAAGGRVVGLPGEPWNLKITTPADPPLAAALLDAGLV